MQPRGCKGVVVAIVVASGLALSLIEERALARPCYTNPIARARGSGGETELCVTVGEVVHLTGVYPGAYSYDPDNGPPHSPGNGIDTFRWFVDGQYWYGETLEYEFDRPGEEGIILKVWDDEQPPYQGIDDDVITVWVVTVDVETEVEDEEEYPGLYVNVNWDDDDLDGWTPNDNPPNAAYEGDKDDDEITGDGDDDFRVFRTTISPDHAPVSGVITFQNNIKVWQTNAKKMLKDGIWQSSEIPSGSAFAADEFPSLLNIEGQSGTDNFRDVSLEVTVKYGQDEICSDVVKITVFEVTLSGFFNGDQHDSHECEVRHCTFEYSSDMNGKISWDDGNGDGDPGDEDHHCQYFHNCMECQGTVEPEGVGIEVDFVFNRWLWAKAWIRWSEEDEWDLDRNDTPWRDDTTFNFLDQDRSPSLTDHIYEIDGPGPTFRDREECNYLADIGDLKECVFVKLPDGDFYQCSDWHKWHYQIYLKPKEGTEWLTRDAPAKQKLGGGWINVPDNL